MIEKLESAGLGFYVKATETQQKLGSFQFYTNYDNTITFLNDFI